MTQQVPVNNKRRIKGFPDNWREYIIALSVQGILPLVPIILEQIFAGYVKNSSIIITAAIYSVSVGLYCQEKLTFIFSLLSLAFMAFLHGVSMQSGKENSNYHTSALIIIVLFSFVLVLKKFNEHVMDNKKAWEFF